MTMTITCEGNELRVWLEVVSYSRLRGQRTKAVDSTGRYGEMVVNET
jgi:hypothetical protein